MGRTQANIGLNDRRCGMHTVTCLRGRMSWVLLCGPPLCRHAAHASQGNTLKDEPAVTSIALSVPAADSQHALKLVLRKPR